MYCCWESLDKIFGVMFQIGGRRSLILKPKAEPLPTNRQRAFPDRQSETSLQKSCLAILDPPISQAASCYHAVMKRTMIQFDEDTYHKLRHRAFEQRRSISSVARELVANGLESGKRRKLTRLKQLRSVGAARSKQGLLSPVSERHDEALASVILKK